MKVGSLFSGIGMLDYGLHLAGMEHEFFCEVDPWRRGILGLRWPDATIYDDIRRDWSDAPRVDVIAGGFPCKGASSAGKRNGFGHPETVLWREMRRAISEIGPRYVLVENVAAILSLHNGAVWGEVLRDLDALGFDAVWDCLPASSFGAPHRRDRVFLIAHAQVKPERKQADKAEPVPGSGQAWKVSCGGSRQFATDANLQFRPERNQQTQTGQRTPHGNDARGRGVQVEWGEYESAVRRWEAITRPAPPPLTGVCGVDDGTTGGLEQPRKSHDRKRISALGDGALVAAGWTAGRYVMQLEEER